MFPDLSWGIIRSELSHKENNLIHNMERFDRLLIEENAGRASSSIENKPALFYHVYKDLSSSHELRSHALQTLREWIICSWTKIKAIWNDLDLYCACLIEDISCEKDKRFLEDLCDLMCFFGCERGDEWPAGKKFMRDCSFSSDTRLQNIAMRAAFNNKQCWSRELQLFDADGSNVKQLIIYSILYSAEGLRRNAVRALTIYVLPRDYDMLTAFPSLLPKIIEIASEVECHSTYWDPPLVALNCLEDVSENCVSLLAAHVDSVVAVCNKTITRSCRSGVDILEYLYEKKPTWIHPNHIPGMISSSILAILNETAEMEVWNRRVDLDPSFIDTDEIGVRHVQHAIKHFGTDLMGPQLLATACEYLQQDDWKIRAAAMRALASVVAYDRAAGGLGPEAAAKVADMAIDSLSDLHPRVVYESCWCLSELVSHYPEYLDETRYDRFFAAILAHDAKPRLPPINLAIACLLFNLTTEYRSHVPRPRQLPQVIENLLVVHVDGLQALLQSIIVSMQRENCQNNNCARSKAFYTICSLQGCTRYFPAILLEYIKGNPRHIVSEPVSDDPCFACYERAPDVVIRRRPSCFLCHCSGGSCVCPPRWCSECIAQIYLADNERARPHRCPFCLQQYCKEDILCVEAAVEEN